MDAFLHVHLHVPWRRELRFTDPADDLRPDLFKDCLAHEETYMATRDDGRTQVARLGTDQTLGREQLRRCHQLVIACGQQKDRRLDFRKLNLLSQSNEAASCEFVALVELFHHFEEESTREVDGPGIPVPELCFELG